MEATAREVLEGWLALYKLPHRVVVMITWRKVGIKTLGNKFMEAMEVPLSKHSDLPERNYPVPDLHLICLCRGLLPPQQGGEETVLFQITLQDLYLSRKRNKWLPCMTDAGLRCALLTSVK